MNRDEVLNVLRTHKATIVRIADGRGDDDLLNLLFEIKGERREDAKDKKTWTPIGSLV